MIAMSVLSTYDEYRRGASPVYPVPRSRLVRNAVMHALAWIGMGLGGVEAVDDDDYLGVG